MQGTALCQREQLMQKPGGQACRWGKSHLEMQVGSSRVGLLSSGRGLIPAHGASESCLPNRPRLAAAENGHSATGSCRLGC